MAEALIATIADVGELTRAVGETARSNLNLAASDGKHAVVSRYTTGDGDGLSLYLRGGSQYVCQEGVCRMLDATDRYETVLVASEPLTEEPGWQQVPRNHLVMIDEDLRLEMREIP
jgi:glutamine amidotransferase